MENAVELHILRTMKHKSFVLKSAEILIRYLYNNNRDLDAYILSQRVLVHDNSKLLSEEIKAFVSIDDNQANLKDPNLPLSDKTKKALEIHWKNNSHHPEHFKNIYDMSEIDIMEMAIDCHSRSIEYNTDFLNFVQIRQNERFKFPEDFFDKYFSYCKILNDGYKKEKNKEYIK